MNCIKRLLRGKPGEHEEIFDPMFKDITDGNIDSAIKKIENLSTDLYLKLTGYKIKICFWKPRMDMLGIAIEWKHWNLVEYLVNKSPNANYSHIGRAIYKIICSKYAEKYMLTKRLVDNYAEEKSLNWSDSNGYTALHMLAFQIIYLFKSNSCEALQADIDLATHLIERGADPFSSPIYYGYDGYTSRPPFIQIIRPLHYSGPADSKPRLCQFLVDLFKKKLMPAAALICWNRRSNILADKKPDLEPEAKTTIKSP